MGWVLLILFAVGCLAFCAFSLLKLIAAIKERKADKAKAVLDDNETGKEDIE